jgi:hypothetical protein
MTIASRMLIHDKKHEDGMHRADWDAALNLHSPPALHLTVLCVGAKDVETVRLNRERRERSERRRDIHHKTGTKAASRSGDRYSPRRYRIQPFPLQHLLGYGCFCMFYSSIYPSMHKQTFAPGFVKSECRL